MHNSYSIASIDRSEAALARTFEPFLRRKQGIVSVRNGYSP